MLTLGLGVVWLVAVVEELGAWPAPHAVTATRAPNSASAVLAARRAQQFGGVIPADARVTVNRNGPKPVVFVLWNGAKLALWAASACHVPSL